MSLIIETTLLLCLSAPGVLIGSAELAEGPGALAVDARSEAAFHTGHIPGSAHLDVDTLSEERDGVVGLLKPLPDLVELFVRAGLDPNRRIVVYSGLEEASDLKRATRLFWVLEYAGFPDVRLLDGGLAKWKAEERPLETGPSKIGPLPKDALKELVHRQERLATREAILGLQSSQKGIIADLRSESDFSGKSKKEFVARGGHIAGAENRPAPMFVEGPYFTFKTPEAIIGLLNVREGATAAPVITYCNTGRDATVGYVAYRLAGFKGIAVYDGSMAEWGNREDCPVSLSVND